MNQLWQCGTCDRTVNGFVNGWKCPTCGSTRGSNGEQVSVGFAGP